MDDHASLLTRCSGFESWPGYGRARDLVPSSSGQDVPLTWGRAVVRVHPGPLDRQVSLVREGLPDWRRDPPGTRVSDKPCGFDSRPFRSGLAEMKGRSCSMVSVV